MNIFKYISHTKAILQQHLKYRGGVRLGPSWFTSTLSLGIPGFPPGMPYGFVRFFIDFFIILPPPRFPDYNF